MATLLLGIAAGRRCGVSVLCAGPGASSGGPMPRGVKKENLPSKVCVQCKRPFTWRKKWERCWDEVKCCSKRCKAEFKASHPGVSAGPDVGDGDTDE